MSKKAFFAKNWQESPKTATKHLPQLFLTAIYVETIDFCRISSFSFFPASPLLFQVGCSDAEKRRVAMSGREHVMSQCDAEKRIIDFSNIFLRTIPRKILP
jgi:hypothetical protein